MDPAETHPETCLWLQPQRTPMNSDFLKIVRMSLKYRWSVAASVLNALLIGVLWSVSITAVYPVLEVVFRGNTFDDWIDEEIRSYDDSILETDRKIAALQLPGALHPDAKEPAALRPLQLQKDDYARSKNRLQRLHASIGHWLPQTPFRTMALMMALLLVLTIVKGICIVSQATLVARVAEGTVVDLRRKFYNSILRMDQIVIDRHGSAQVMSQLSHNINLVGGGLKNLYGQSVREPLKMLACLVAAAFVSSKLLLLSLLVTPIGLLAIRAVTGRVKTASRGHMGGVAAILQTLGETIAGLRMVKVFNREPTEARRFRANSQSLYVISLRMSFYDAILNPVAEVIGIMALSVAILSGAWLVLNQETHLFGLQISDQPLSPSTLFMFFGLLAGASGPARKMSGVFNALTRANMASVRLFEMFDKPAEVVAQLPVSRVPSHCKSIRFDNVSFAYHLLQRVVHNVTLEVPFGQKVAFVGHNGCGKTTLMHLLTRFYDPTEGSIFLDDVDLRNLNPRNLRQEFSMISQEPFLFDGTIAENIAYGGRNPTAQQIKDAARIALVDEFTKNLPEGLNYPIGERGKRLSGGQRQRIAIARAIVGNPQILVLDEATSQIDLEAESRLQNNLKEYLKNRTVFIIAHRRTALELADRVVVMAGGRIVADTTAADYLERTNDDFEPTIRIAG